MVVSGDFTSTFTGGTCESDAPQLKQYLASSELALPQTLHAGILQTTLTIAIKQFLTIARAVAFVFMQLKPEM